MTSLRTVDRQSFPMRLWEKAKRHGVWNPTAVDLTTDLAQWPTLPAPFRHSILEMCATFLAGEETVCDEILPFIRVVAREGRVDEQLFLSSFLWDEARHVDLFQRFFREVSPEFGRTAYRGDEVAQRIFDDYLRPALEQLEADASPEAQVRASVTYHLVVEGALAETGYFVFRTLLGRSNCLPGMREAMTLLQRDESRHIAFGVYVVSRLIQEHGDVAFKAFVDRVNELSPLVREVMRRLAHSLENAGDAITARELAAFSQRSFVTRVRHIAKARNASRTYLHDVGTFDAEEDEGRERAVTEEAV
jgi:ribonucleoside-diphosphate reductase beta chain